jgi:hypothetical protein
MESELTKNTASHLAPIDSLALFTLLPAIAMSLGWGLRGTIGGGQIGAMIPGAIVMLCLCHLLGWRSSLGIVTAIGTVGIGLGGQETYGQTIGFLRDSNTVLWGLLGLTIKGAMWGLSGGVLVGLAFTHQKYRWWEIAIGLSLMVMGTVLGRELIDKPRLLYFSNLLDKPREEVWVGVTVGALSLLGYLMVLRREKISTTFAVGGFLAGAAGFGGGSLFLALGSALPQPYSQWQWWKMMEFTFGALFGLGLGAIAFQTKEALRQVDAEMEGLGSSDPFQAVPSIVMIIMGLSLAMAGILLNFSLPHRASFSIIAPALILLSLMSNRLAWHVAISMTVCGFLRDFFRGGIERGWFDGQCSDWRVLLMATVPMVAFVTLAQSRGRLSTVTGLLCLTWLATAFGLVKMIIPYNGAIPSYFVSAVFIVELLMVTGMIWSQSIRRINF